jgi:RNA polymerase sigma-70 factor (ECF subfamily)
MRTLRLLGSNAETPDEELMTWLAAGRQEALGPLYSRYAGLVFNLAAQSLDRPTAEEIVQDVFLAIWRRVETFDAQRGAFRPWLLQIAHNRVLNELRRRSRRPRVEPPRSRGDTSDFDDGDPLRDLADGDPLPDEAAWHRLRDLAVFDALFELPPNQRQALDLAFFEDLSHQQVASTLNVPLGTAKSRIRAGLHSLRGKLAPVVAALALAGTLAGLGVRYQGEQAALERDERALALVPSSDTQAIRVTAASGADEVTHGTYRGRPGSPIAIMTFSFFAAPPAGQTYQAWVRHDGTWMTLGAFQPDPGGSARLIAEGSAFTALPDAIVVTVEPATGSASPTGPAVIAWPDH